MTEEVRAPLSPSSPAVGGDDAAVPGSLYVSRMLAKVVARPGLVLGPVAAMDGGCCLPRQDSSLKPGKLAPAEMASSDCRLASKYRQEQIEQARILASEVCRRLLYVCLLTTGFNANLLAQVLLARCYQHVCRRRIDEDEQLLPLIQRMCGPVEWARCAGCCRSFRDRGLSQPGFLKYWFSGYSAEGQRGAMKFAIQHNMTNLVRPLIDAKADVNCVFEQFWFRTPLHRAASRGHSELCKLLLALKANPRLRDSHGAAPIHLVASKGRLPIVDLLLRHDPAGATASDYSGRTPCHMAALKGHLGIVQQLVEARASADAQATDGRTPLDMAQRGQHVHVVGFLERWRRRQDLESEAHPAARHVLEALFERALSSMEATATSQLAPQPTPEPEPVAAGVAAGSDSSSSQMQQQ